MAYFASAHDSMQAPARSVRSNGDTAMSELRINPVAAEFPQLEDILFNAPVVGMRSHGQRLPIVLYEGMLWDGRVRYPAWAELGLKLCLVPLRRESP